MKLLLPSLYFSLLASSSSAAERRNKMAAVTKEEQHNQEDKQNRKKVSRILSEAAVVVDAKNKLNQEERSRMMSTTSDDYYYTLIDDTIECPEGHAVPQEECALAGFFTGNELREGVDPLRYDMSRFSWQHTPIGCFGSEYGYIYYSTGDASKFFDPNWSPDVFGDKTWSELHSKICKRPDKTNPKSIPNSHFIEVSTETAIACNGSSAQKPITDPQECAFGGLFLGGSQLKKEAMVDGHLNQNLQLHNAANGDDFPMGCFVQEEADGNKYIHHSTGTGAAFTGRDDTDKFTLICKDSTQEAPSLALVSSIVPGGGGDPHFQTFNGQFFSYHGQCDLVLMRSKTFKSGSGLDVHIRTTRVDNPRGISYSYISSAAVGIERDVLEVSNDGHILINGKDDMTLDNNTDNTSPVLSTVFAGYTLTKTRKGSKNRIATFDLDLHDGKHIIIRCNTKNGMIFVDINGHFDDSEGLLGAPLGSKNGDELLSRDGSLDMTGNWNSYGEEWQVRDTEPMLFQESREPQYPVTCSYDADHEDSKKTQLRRRLLHNNAEDAVTREEATEACAHTVGEKKNFCIDDVMVTGDLELSTDPFYN